MLDTPPELIDLQHLEDARWHVVWRERPECYFVGVIEVTPEWDRDDRGAYYVEHAHVEWESITVCDNEDDEIGKLDVEHTRVDPRLIVSMQPALRQAAERAAETADPPGV